MGEHESHESEDDEARVGTEAHYQDAAYYDQVYRRRKADVAFYAALVEPPTEASSPPTVLELGCGTGRVSLAIAARGAEVVGVDAMPTMLARAEQRRARARKDVRARTRFVHGDLRALRLRRRFDLVVSPFNVFNHLYTRVELERAFATVRAHLAPDGRFVFDVRVPQVVELARPDDRVYSGGVLSIPSKGGRFRYRERFAWDPVSQIQTIDMAFLGDDDPSQVEVTPLWHRQLFPAELEALVHYNGFELVARYGDFERGPLDAWSETQILICRARRRR